MKLVIFIFPTQRLILTFTFTDERNWKKKKLMRQNHDITMWYEKKTNEAYTKLRNPMFNSVHQTEQFLFCSEDRRIDEAIVMEFCARWVRRLSLTLFWCRLLFDPTISLPLTLFLPLTISFSHQHPDTAIAYDNDTVTFHNFIKTNTNQSVCRRLSPEKPGTKCEYEKSN